MYSFRVSCYRPFSGKEPTICDAVKIILDILGFGAIILTFRVTQRICVTVAHRTLTPFAGVRIPHPLPIIKATQSGGFYYWQRMKLDSKGRHQCAHWCNKQSSGLFVSPWENPWTYRRTLMGVDVSPFPPSHHGRFFSFAESNPSSSANAPAAHLGIWCFSCCEGFEPTSM